MRILKNPKAWYAFETLGPTFRLIRFIGERRTHDFFFPVKEPIWMEDDQSRELECQLSLEDFVKALPKAVYETRLTQTQLSKSKVLQHILVSQSRQNIVS